MKKLIIAALALCLGTSNVLHAQDLPDQKETLNTLIKVNRYYMKTIPTADSPVLYKVRYAQAIYGHEPYTTKDYLPFIPFIQIQNITIMPTNGENTITGECGEEQQPDMRTITLVDRFI